MSLYVFEYTLMTASQRKPETVKPVVLLNHRPAALSRRQTVLITAPSVTTLQRLLLLCDDADAL